MLSTSLTIVLAAASARVALAIPTNGTCQEFEGIPIIASSTGYRYTYPEFKDNFDVVDIVTRLVSRDAASFSTFSGSVPLSGNYSIGAGVCNPNVTTGREKILLVPTHGLGYDGFYWDPPSTRIADQQYNFANYLVGQGYSVFNWDRLGVHRSTRVDGYNEAQTSQQVEVLRQLLKTLRSGQFTGTIGVPDKIVLIGHSYGSWMSNALVAGNSSDAPLVDGLILTGFGYNISTNLYFEGWDLKIGSTMVSNFSDYNSGYLTWNDLYSNVATFFSPYYNRTIANVTEATKTPFAISEALTFGSLDLYSPAYTGPVQILNGQLDLGICGGNCTDLVEPYASKMFPNAKVVEVVEHPEAGHSINFHYNATGAFDVMAQFLNTYVA